MATAWADDEEASIQNRRGGLQAVAPARDGCHDARAIKQRVEGGAIGRGRRIKRGGLHWRAVSEDRGQATVQPAWAVIRTTLASSSRPSIAAASSRPHSSIARTCSGQRLAR